MQVDVDNDVRTLVEDKVNIIRIKKDISAKRSPLENKKKAVEEVFRDLNKRQIAIEKEKKFYTDNDSCPTCQQTIDNRVDILAKRIETGNEIDVAVHKLDDTLHAIAVEMEGVVEMENMLDGFERTAASKETRIRNETERIKSLHGEIAELRIRNESPSDDREKVLRSLEDAIAVLDGEKFVLSQQKKSHDIAYTMLKDSGIKSKIIENYLPIINAQINEHLQDLDFYVKFELDEAFNETIKSRHLDEFTYASFSEGEKARIDLALLFTWRKIAELKNSVSTNLLILDEVFDGSLDAIGADEVMAKLLFRQAEHFNGEIRENQNTNVFVISHKIDLVDKFTETIKFEKVRGFSKMV
jgi:hypothetical protein